jgi:hypothetical protein
MSFNVGPMRAVRTPWDSCSSPGPPVKDGLIFNTRHDEMDEKDEAIADLQSIGAHS